MSSKEQKEADKIQKQKVEKSIKEQVAAAFANEPSEDTEEVNDKQTSKLTKEEIENLIKDSRAGTE